MGYSSVEVSEENRDAFQEAKAKGMEAYSDGKLEEAIQHLTEAILLNPTSYDTYATRATLYMKMKKPNAAIRDADAAQMINLAKQQENLKAAASLQRCVKMETEDLSLDRISNLPSSIIENILCLVPIQVAARTSILSKYWRYNWTNIPKLVFVEDDMIVESSDRFFEAIHQVLLLHQDPIFEFSFLTENEYREDEDGKREEIEWMIFLLGRNRNTLKKLTLRLAESRYLELPRSIYTLQQLTDLYITGIYFGVHTIFDGFGNLTILYAQGLLQSKASILHLLSNCPLLKRFELVPQFDNVEQDITIIELLMCLPVIEHMTLDTWNVKIVEYEFTDDGTKLVTLKDCSDVVWLEHLKELEIAGFAGRKGEMEFVKLILAKSPVLMKVRIILKNRVTEDEEEIMRVLLGSPCVSSLAEMTVDR